MAELFREQPFHKPEVPALAAELKKLQHDYFLAQSQAENRAAYAERIRHTRVFQESLKAKGYDPDAFYLWHVLIGSSVSEDMQISFLDTPDRDIEAFIRQEFAL